MQANPTSEKLVSKRKQQLYFILLIELLSIDYAIEDINHFTFGLIYA